jgi:hypothetical protein
LLKEQKTQRKSVVKTMVNNSPEKRAYMYVEDSLLPSIYSAFNELQSQADLLQTAIERSSPILQQIFPITSTSSFAPHRPPDVLKENREVFVFAFVASDLQMI